MGRLAALGLIRGELTEGIAWRAVGGIALTYDGLSSQMASDSSASYSRDPAGQITGAAAAGGGKAVALSNQHGDLSGTFTAAGTAMAGSVT